MTHKFVYEGVVHAVEFFSGQTTVLVCGWHHEIHPTDADRAESRPVNCLECLAHRNTDGARRDGDGCKRDGTPDTTGPVRTPQRHRVRFDSVRRDVFAPSAAGTEEGVRELSDLSQRPSPGELIHKFAYRLPAYIGHSEWSLCGVRIVRYHHTPGEAVTCLECLAWMR